MQLRKGEKNVVSNRYVILKGQNGGLILNENCSFWDMVEPRISSIEQCQCGSNICNINGNIV